MEIIKEENWGYFDDGIVLFASIFPSLMKPGGSVSPSLKKPLASVWDSLEEVPQLQPSSDSSGTLPVDTALAEGVQAELGLPTPAAITPPKAPLLFSQETDDLHIEANVLEHYRELYPGLYRTVMTIQRVSASVGGGSNGQERTDESIWAEPSLPYEAGDTDELTDEQIWAIPSFPPAAGSRASPK